ncbi:MAG: anaerobic nitric oxide reductase flavorubredoxin [Desulfobacterales bacterium]|nr:anaerobic nitric oxide reductase flavorubredoxin [Desulfobacterales bacterium]
MKINVKNNVDWIGKIDWELRKFHGDEYSTHRGSSYNSYLIQEEKNVVIDTIWKPFAKDYIENLKTEIDLKKIDYIIVNHAEVDHSGSLPELMSLIPDTPIYCTKNALRSIKGHYHEDWNFNPVKTGDSIDIGNGKSLVFVEMRMLHWPDSMATYLTKDNVLFSNDAFGQHYASEYMFNDLVDQNELFTECIKYYANILTPFNKFVEKKIKEVLDMKIPIDIIATSHGIIWRDNPTQIIEKYLSWATAYKEDQITILYDSMWDATRIMAENIAKGIKAKDDKVDIKLFNIAKTDKNDILTEVFKSKIILVGSPTINQGITVATAGLLEAIEGLKFKGKKAAAFGSYGWSGESVKKINKVLENSGFEMINKGLKCLWKPDTESIEQCISFGNEIAGS